MAAAGIITVAKSIPTMINSLKIGIRELRSSAAKLNAGKLRTQRDLSILLEIGGKDVTALETGAIPPSVEQICRLSIIYNRSFTGLYQDLMREAREALFRNMPDLPECTDEGVDRFNRDNTLKRLDRELTAALTKQDEGA